MTDVRHSVPSKDSAARHITSASCLRVTSPLVASVAWPVPVLLLEKPPSAGCEDPDAAGSHPSPDLRLPGAHPVLARPPSPPAQPPGDTRQPPPLTPQETLRVGGGEASCCVDTGSRHCSHPRSLGRLGPSANAGGSDLGGLPRGGRRRRRAA